MFTSLYTFSHDLKTQEVLTSAPGEVYLGLEREDGEGEGDGGRGAHRHQHRVHLVRGGHHPQHQGLEHWPTGVNNSSQELY